MMQEPVQSAVPGSRRLRFAIAIPQFVADGTFDPAGFRAYLARAEALGFDSAWTQQQVLAHGLPILDPVTAMTYAAACTERLRLGCAVFVTTLHNPVHLAKNLSSLDQLCRGRLEVGVGTGGEGRVFSAFAVDRDSLVARFNEGLRLMKAVWTEPRVTFQGRFWQIDGAAMEPKPFQKPHPPIWFGGHHPAALRRAVRHGDGFFGAGSSTTAQFVEHVRTVRELLAEAGRDAASFRIAKRVYIAVDDDAERARQRVSAALERMYGRPGTPPYALWGTPETCVQGLREVAEAGAELIQLVPFFDPAEQMEQMERLAAEVIPQLA
jgi:probable F420-dependent oxidoreductase